MRKALIVGIDNYHDCPLSCCANDAEAINELLSRNADGSPNFEVKLINNSITKGELKEQLSALFNGRNEVELFYFAGHGAVEDGRSYIVSTDYFAHDLGVDLDYILTLANNSSSAHKIIILDSCFSGAMGSPALFGNSAAHIGNGVTILSASMDNETAGEIDNHGVFTALLIDALNGEAADIIGNITPGSIYSYIDKALGAWDQRPVFKTNVSSFLSIRQVKSAIPIEHIRKITTYFSDKNDEFSLDPSYEFTNDPEIKHTLIKPYANQDNVLVFKELQRLESVGLVKPIGEEHMYFAAMNSQKCALTAMGKHFWNLVKKGKI